MTSHKDQIQALINEIDGVLNKPSPRLLSAMAGGTDQQRLVLEQTRSYLASLQRDMAASESPGLTASSAIGYDTASYSDQSGAAESAQQVLQAVLQEMSYLRTNFMQPLRHDVENLQQQRDALAQEVRLLEAQRQQYLLPQQQAANQQQMINEFLQSLMGRLQENLTGQVAQMLTGLEGQPLQGRSLTPGATIEVEGFPSELPPPYQPMLTPRQRLEQIQMLQTQSDQLLLKLDSTLRVIFESLQSNIQSYQESLTQGLDKMHSLGQQGEAMFAALVNRLAQQLGREASTYLQSSLQSSDWEAAGRPPLPSTVLPTPAAGSTTFPGEVPLPPVQDEEISDEQIDLLLNELKVSEPVTVIQPPDEDEMMAAINASQSSTAEPPPVMDLDSLDLSNLELVQLPPAPPPRAGQNAIDVDDDITFFQMDQPLTSFQLDDADFARLQTDLELATSTETVAETEQEIDDIDSALDLLNQLSAELQTEAPASSDQEGANITQVEAIAPPPAQDDEMTDLYQSLFGDLAPVFSEDITENLAPEPIDQHIADADLTASPTSSTESPGIESDALPADDLFGGLTDPSQVEDSIASDEIESGEPDVLGDLLDGPLFTDDTAFDQPAAGGEIDAISSLSDLIENPSLGSDTDLTEVLNTESSDSIEAEDTFIPAAPDEVLLVSPQETEAPEPNRSLALDADTIHQLTADLSSLEEFYTSPVSDDTDMELTEGANWTLDDLTRQSEEDIAASLDSISLDDDITELLSEGLPSDLSPASSLEAELPSLSPIDHPIPLDLEEPSEITEIIEPTVASDLSLFESSSEAQPSESVASDEITPDSLFALDEHDELDLDATPTNLEDLFESLSAAPEPSSPAIAEADLPDDLFTSVESEPEAAVEPQAAKPEAATDLTSDDLFAGLEFDQPEPGSDSSQVATDLAADLTAEVAADQRDPAPSTETTEGLDDLELDQLFADVTDTPSAPPVEAAVEAADGADESAGMTLGEFGASLEALPLESGEADPLAGLFDDAELSASEESLDTELSNLSLDEFGELLPLPFTTPSSDVTPASAALHAMDTAAPLPPIPLDEEATIDDFFAAATPVELSQMEAAEPSDAPLPTTSEPPVETAPAIAPGDGDEANAFTLEGMVDSLFEDAPNIASAETIESTESPPSVDDAEKKKRL